MGTPQPVDPHPEPVSASRAEPGAHVGRTPTPDAQRAQPALAGFALDAAAEAFGLLGRLDVELGQGGQRPVEGAAGRRAVTTGQCHRDQHGVGVSLPGSTSIARPTTRSASFTSPLATSSSPARVAAATAARKRSRSARSSRRRRRPRKPHPGRRDRGQVVLERQRWCAVGLGLRRPRRRGRRTGRRRYPAIRW